MADLIRHTRRLPHSVCHTRRLPHKAFRAVSVADCRPWCQSPLRLAFGYRFGQLRPLTTNFLDRGSCDRQAINLIRRSTIRCA